MALEYLADAHSLASMSNINISTAPNSLSKNQLIQEAALLTFCDPLPDQCLQLLLKLSGMEWRMLLTWLDISGLALYFLDRIVELQLGDRLPSTVIGRLKQNLIDNTRRTDGMIAESVAIQREFQEARLDYAALKGFSLFPSAVPKLELRHQLDLDFLVAEMSIHEARRILERRGYRLYAISGKSWEFKKNEIPNFSLKDLYKDLPSRTVELHLATNTKDHPSPLQRIRHQEFHGISMPVLSPVDLFLGHGLHVYKDICSEFSRTAHLLEFRRHVLANRDNDNFWNELQSMAEGNPRASLGLGVITQLITHIMGDFAPDAFTNWTVRRLPQSVQLWVELYGRRTVLRKLPGNKLYLILQKELESAHVSAKRSLRQALLPQRLPPAIIKAATNETLSGRVRRYRVQLHFILFRLRFHLVEGVRYTWESYRWRRYVNRFTQ